MSTIDDTISCFVSGSRFRKSSDRENFGDSLLEMDDSIGQVLSAIRKSGEWNNTIVIFTSDNGSNCYLFEMK